MTRAAVGILADSYNLTATPTPPDQITGLQMWYDASDAATLTVVSVNHVSQWNDKTATARHLTQGTDSARPITGTRTINGRNVLDFVAASSTRIQSAAMTLAHPLTMVVICQSDKIDSAYHIVVGATGNIITLGVNTGQWRQYAGGAVQHGGTETTSPTCLVGAFNAAASTLHVNGVQVIAAGSGTSGFSNAGFLVSANSSVWDGTVAEIAVYNKVLTTTERQGLEAHLQSKWGIP